MKKLCLVCALGAFGFIALPWSATGAQTSLDPATVSRLEAFVNQKRLISREIVGTNVVYTFRKGAQTWAETNALKTVEGTIQPRRFSRLRLYAALAQIGKWQQFEEWLKGQEIGGLNAWTAFWLANELKSDHPMFTQFYEAAKNALGLDEATAAAIMNQAEEL